MADEAEPKTVMDAAHAAIGGVQAGLEEVVARLDRLVDVQAQTLDHVIRLAPVKAVETELEGSVDALSGEPDKVDPPATTPNAPEHTDSPLRKFHNVIG